MTKIIAIFVLVLGFSISAIAISEEEARELAAISKYRTGKIDAAGKEALAKYKISKYSSSKAYATSLLYRATPKSDESLYSEFAVHDYIQRMKGERNVITREELMAQISKTEASVKKAGLDIASVTPLLVYLHYRDRNEWIIVGDKKLAPARIFRTAFLTAVFDGSEISSLDMANKFDARALQEAKKQVEEAKKEPQEK